MPARRTSHLITGIVRDPGGKPVAGARISFVQSPVPMPDVALVTGEDGRFTLGVPVKGPYELAVDTDGFQRATIRITIEKTSPVNVEIRLRR
jgi:Carboxypeptidase regulatory-like domain